MEFDERELSCVDVDGYANILLIGVDARDINNFDNTRADAIIIASIEEETGKVHLTSIYRDTYLKSGSSTFYDKITHSFSYGGIKETIKTINQALDLNITQYVVFNFKAVADVVDSLEGIELDIEEYEIDELNKYAKETAKIIGSETPAPISKAGKQTLSGCQAVSYGRIRKGVGDDFKRTDRMRTVVHVLLEKVREIGIKDKDKLINIAVPQIKTNLSTNDVLALAFNIGKYHIDESSGFPYTLTTGYLNEVSYVFPANLYDDVVTLHEKVFNQKDYVPSDLVLEMSNRILGDIGSANSQQVVNVEEYYSNPYNQPDILQADVGEPIEIPVYAPEEETIEEAVETGEEQPQEETPQDIPSEEGTEEPSEEGEGQGTEEEPSSEGETPAEEGSEYVEPSDGENSGESGEGESEPVYEEESSGEGESWDDGGESTEPEVVDYVEPEPSSDYVEEPPVEETPIDEGAEQEG